MIDSEQFKSFLKAVEDMCGSGEDHPKLKKLYEILSDYFSNAENIQNKSRAMIFTQNRASAMEIHQSLKKNTLIKSSIFVGHSKCKRNNDLNVQIMKQLGDWNQKKQLSTLDRFKNYELNTLIATCIGEEGLDIGEVDLIVCYDSGFSPIRIVQRMGRTGRQRKGKVIVLLMEGKEFFIFRASMKKHRMLKESLKGNKAQANELTVSQTSGKKQYAANYTFYSSNSRMIPDEITPKLKFIDEIDEGKIIEKLMHRREEGKAVEDESFEEILNSANVEDNCMMSNLKPEGTSKVSAKSLEFYMKSNESGKKTASIKPETQKKREVIVIEEEEDEIIVKPRNCTFMEEEEACGEEEADSDKISGIDGIDDDAASFFSYEEYEESYESSELEDDYDNDDDSDVMEIDRSDFEAKAHDKKRSNPYYESIFTENKKTKSSLDY